MNLYNDHSVAMPPREMKSPRFERITWTDERDLKSIILRLVVEHRGMSVQAVSTRLAGCDMRMTRRVMDEMAEEGMLVHTVGNGPGRRYEVGETPF